MSSYRWIGGLLGWVSAGPIGALVGFLLGSVADHGAQAAKRISSGQTYRNVGSGYNSTEQRNSFLVSLLVLSSAVIRADGRYHQSELDYVKAFVRRNFGEDAVLDAMKVLQILKDKEINIWSVGSQISSNMNYSQRLQLFHYLVQLANVDGELCLKEKEVLENVARAISVNQADAASVIAMFYRDTFSAYAILEIPSTATDDEVKAAYRRMAMKNHPDKVATLGPDIQKAAQEKFQKIQQAYEDIKRQRGMN